MKSKRNWLYVSLIGLSILASLKMIFFTAGLDEEYQVVMAYRNAHGDRLFLDMWEPHQSSAFLCTLLMKPYLALFGTTGIVLYLRFWGTLLHLGVSIYLYATLRTFLEKKYAWLLALIYYNTIPKQIILPEFGIMQVWFYTLLSLFLLNYYMNGRKCRYLVLASLSLVLNILSYPSCLILFPFLLVFLARFSGRDKWRDMGILTLLCGVCGIGYLGMLFTHTSPGELVETLSHILDGDITHSLTFGGKALGLLLDGLYLTALWGGCLLLSAVVAKWKKLDKCQFYCLTAILACGLELFYWIILRQGYEAMHIHLAAFALAGLCVSPRERNNFPEADKISLLKYCMAGAALSLLAVLYLTDLALMASIPHAMPAAFYGAVLLILSQTQKTAQNGASSKWIYVTLIIWCLTAVFGKGYLLRSGTAYQNVLQSGGIMRKGPAAGTISNYMGAYIYNCDYEDWQLYLQDGDHVLIVVNQVMNLGTMQYLFKDVEISHFSIVNPTAYDERLLEYWDLYPERIPNVIIVDCWYGDLLTEPDSWIMQYIQSDFGYVQSNDGRYIRIYRK